VHFKRFTRLHLALQCMKVTFIALYNFTVWCLDTGALLWEPYYIRNVIYLQKLKNCICFLLTRWVQGYLNLRKIWNLDIKKYKLPSSALQKIDSLWLIVKGCHGCKSWGWYSRIIVNKWRSNILYTVNAVNFPPAEINSLYSIMNFLLLYWQYNPMWAFVSSTRSCSAPLFFILIHQRFWDLPLHYPPTLGLFFQSSLCLKAWKNFISCTEISCLYWWVVYSPIPLQLDSLHYFRGVI
jgi:hypothetical protein